MARPARKLRPQRGKGRKLNRPGGAAPEPTTIPEPERIRNRKAWQRLRDYYRREHPFCEDPEGRHPTPVPADHIHHLIPIVRDPSKALDEGNLQALCIQCHARAEARERWGHEAPDRPTVDPATGATLPRSGG